MELPILHKHCVNCFNKHCNITDAAFDQATSCRMVSCNQFACPSRFHECKLQDHLLWCPCKKVPCINQVNGCPWIIPRWKLGVHLEVCPASVIRCSSEWNRWPMHSSDVKSKVSVPLNNPRIRCAQLDVALAMRDQRMLIDSMKVPVKIRNTLRNALTQRFPAVPITNYRASSAESDYAASRETSSTFSDDEAPWNPSKTPPGLQSSVCSKLIKATKQVTVASALDALDDSSTYIHMNSPLSEIIECRENDNSHQNVSKSDLDVCFTDGYNMFSSALVERKGELVSNSDTNIQLQTQQSLSSGVYLPAQVTKHYVSNLTNEEKLVSDPETDSYSTQLEQGVCETDLDYASEGVNDVSKLLCLDKPVYLNEMLGVDLTIESIARYQAKPSSMYTFLCAQDFRRDEYSWHVKNVHDDIHCRLNGWLEQRCPLSCYGCTFSFRHLHPGYSGSEIIHSTLLESYGLKPSLKSGDEGCLFTSTDADIVHLLKQNKLVREITPEISTSYKFDSEIKIQPHYSVLPNSCESTPYLASSNMDILSALPVHVMRNIARCLDGFSLCNLAMTTKFLREICCSLLEERGIVVQIWERCRSVDKVSWVVAYTKWHFSTVFTPVQHWRFAPVNPLSDHLRTCPFNQDKQQWVHPQKLIAMADCTEMFSNVKLNQLVNTGNTCSISDL